MGCQGQIGCPLSLQVRRTPGEKDVMFKVLYCGICHSDLHFIKNDWGNAKYPAVPGHEIVGIVTKVGRKVRKFKVGEKVGVGCLVGSCRTCDNCTQNLESYCPKMMLTYGSTYHDGTPTYGGYSDIMVADEHFVIRWTENMPLDAGAPLLCAGIKTYSPMKYFGLDKPGMHIRCGEVGWFRPPSCQICKGFRCKVTVTSTSPAKKKEAIERLGAYSFLISCDQDQMNAATGAMEGITDTVSAVHAPIPLENLSKYHGKMVLLGIPNQPLELPAAVLHFGGKIVRLGRPGVVWENWRHEMTDFAAKHKITADAEVVPMDYVNTAMERLVKADVKYRFVIDVGNTLRAE